MINKLEKLSTFMNRMKRLGIEITLTGNLPWIYINTINEKIVKEKFEGEHGFTIGYYPTKVDDTFEFTDITEIFKLIRKYRH